MIRLTKKLKKEAFKDLSKLEEVAENEEQTTEGGNTMNQFRDTQFMSAEDKAKVLKQWETFLKHGCQEKHFTNRLYKHLSLHCEFIAHYNRSGFYATYFRSGEGMALFLHQFDTDDGLLKPSIEYGMDWTAGDYYDINTAMCEVGRKYIPHLIEVAKNAQKLSDVAQATALLKKHGLDFTIKE